MTAERRRQHRIHYHARHHAHGVGAEPGLDLIGGRRVDSAAAALRGEGACANLLFWSSVSEASLEADLNRHLRLLGAVTPAPPPPDGAIYACPMHPNIRQVDPGFCPVCGLPLEPLMAARSFSCRSTGVRAACRIG